MHRMWPVLFPVFLFTCGVSSGQSETPALNDLVKATGVDRPVALLMLVEVQVDLVFSDRQKEEFRRIDQEQAVEFRKLPRVFDLNDLDEEARKQRGQDLRKLQEKRWESSVAVLNDAQRTRLAQILLHQINEGALEIPAVMDGLKLTDEQKGKIEAVKAAFVLTGTKSESPKTSSREEMRRYFDEARRRFDQRNAEYFSVLTPEQSATFAAMKGKPLAQPERPAPKPGEPIPLPPMRLELTLMTQEEVQKELNFTAEQKQKVAALQQENRGAFRAVRPNPGVPRANLPDTDLLNRAQKYTEGLRGVLDEKQVQRLTELTIQRRGPTALQEQQIAEKLKLTAEQKTQLRRIDFDFNGPGRMEERIQATKDGNQAKVNQMMAEDRRRNAKRDADYLNVLTDEQKAAFDALQGPKFTFPESNRPLPIVPVNKAKPEST